MDAMLIFRSYVVSQLAHLWTKYGTVSEQRCAERVLKCSPCGPTVERRTGY